MRLDYQPLFGKMSPHSSSRLSSGRIKDRTQETAEIEPNGLLEPVTSKSQIIHILTLFVHSCAYVNICHEYHIDKRFRCRTQVVFRPRPLFQARPTHACNAHLTEEIS